MLVIVLHLNAAAEIRKFLLSLPEGVRVDLPPKKPAEIDSDKLTGSFVLEYEVGAKTAKLKAAPGTKDGNEGYATGLKRIGNDANVLSFLEEYDSSFAVWTLWLSNKSEDGSCRAAMSTHRSSLIGERAVMFWGSAVEQALSSASKTDFASLMAEAYSADTRPLGSQDLKTILQIHKLVAEWNETSAPLMRDYWDKRITPEDWCSKSRVPLGQMLNICKALLENCKTISDEGVKRSLTPVVQAHAGLLSAYAGLEKALREGSEDGEQKAFKRLQEAGEKKQAAAMPIIQSLRKALGTDDFDKVLAQEAQRLNEKVTPR